MSKNCNKNVLGLNVLNIDCLITSKINTDTVNINETIFGQNPQIFNKTLIIGDPNDRSLCVESSFIVQTNASGIWDVVDITSQSIPILSSTAIDSCVYFGNDAPFAGFVYTAILPFANLSTITIWQYWNGSTWVKLCIMDSQSANTPFEHLTNAPEYLRFEDVSQDWYIKELNNHNKFWIRMCVISSLPFIPVIKDINSFNSHKKILSATGISEFYGTATLERELIFHRKLLDKVNNESPALRDLLLTSTFAIDSNLNSFVHTDEESIGGIFRIPPNTDTSAKLVICLAWYPYTAVPNLRVGYIQWNIEYVYMKQNSLINSSLPSSILSTKVLVDKPNNNQYLYLTEMKIPIEEILPNEMIGIRIFRDEPSFGNPDLYASNINLVDVTGIVRIVK